MAYSMKIHAAALALPLLVASPFAQAESKTAKKNTKTTTAATTSAATAKPTPAKPAKVQRPRIEVAFVLDATGSMGPYINEARRRIKEIAEDLQSGDPAPIVKFALVTYRDRAEAFVTHVDPFSTSIADIKTHLDATKAQGGGDHPEAVLEGLEAALTKLKWSSKNNNVIKMAYLVGDAPAQHYADGPTEKAITRLARKKGVVLHTIACGHNLTEGGKDTWSHLARLTEGRFLQLSDGYRNSRDRDSDAATSGDFASVVGGTSKAYSASVGVDYDSGPALATSSMSEPGTEVTFRSGLLGGHVRWVRDAISWNDLWAAHVSVLPQAERPALPAVDFSTAHVVVTGGAEHGLVIRDIRGAMGSRSATVKPLQSGGVAFVIVPTDGGKIR
jgi:Mg-chelatase subunit ChlD